MYIYKNYNLIPYLTKLFILWIDYFLGLDVKFQEVLREILMLIIHREKYVLRLHVEKLII